MMMPKLAGGGSDYDYITDGLAFWLDGEDATTSKWVDRIGNIPFTMHNVTLNGNGGVVFNGSAYGNYASNLNYPYSSSTIEIVWVTTFNGSIQLAFMINASNMAVIGRGATGTAVYVRSGTTAAKGFTVGASLNTFSSAAGVAYSNASACSAVGTNDSWYLRSGGTFVGSRSASENFFKGTIYQIRIYNRLLTEAEILHNQAIDMARYQMGGGKHLIINKLCGLSAERRAA